MSRSERTALVAETYGNAEFMRALLVVADQIDEGSRRADRPESYREALMACAAIAGDLERTRSIPERMLTCSSAVWEKRTRRRALRTATDSELCWEVARRAQHAPVA